MGTKEMEIRYWLFERREPLTEKMKTTYYNMMENMKQIVKNAINELLEHNLLEYKLLKKVEAALATNDESKQLRINEIIANPNHYIMFHQTGDNFFELDELKIIAKYIKMELEKFLHYEIDAEIILSTID